MRHVLCATELVSGHPVYFERAMVHSPIFGTGKCENVSMAEAIYASAAFPLGFPPLRLRTDRLRLAGGINDDLPDRLVLSDGGVFNNLGTDSFTAFERFDDNPLTPTISAWSAPMPSRSIVVNASSPLKIDRLSNVPIWRSVASSKRIMSVLYENTLRPRIQALQHGHTENATVVDVSESPVELAQRLATTSNPQQARAVLELLRRDRSDADWKEFTDRAASTKTVLSPIGITACVRLIRLGALHASIALHLTVDDWDPDREVFEFAPDEAELIDLIERSR